MATPPLNESNKHQRPEEPYAPSERETAADNMPITAQQIADAQKAVDDAAAANIAAAQQADAQAREAAATPTMPQSNAVTNYETLMGRLQDQDFYRTPSQLAAEKKRERARRIITSVGDGISAISNLISTANYGANAYDGKSTLTGKLKENYDKLIKDREAQKQAYVNGWLGAADKDLANGWRAYLQSYQEGRDKVGDDRYTEKFNYQKEQDTKKTEAQAAAAKQAQENFEKKLKLEENIAKAGNESREQRIARQQSDDRRFRVQQTARGNTIPIYDRNNEQVYTIYETVWDENYQLLFNAISKEYEIARDNGIKSELKRPPQNPTKAQMEAYVRANWQNSESAPGIMDELSQIDPANPKAPNRKPYNPDEATA